MPSPRASASFTASRKASTANPQSLLVTRGPIASATCSTLPMITTCRVNPASGPHRPRRSRAPMALAAADAWKLRDSAVQGVQWPSCQGPMEGSDPPGRLGWNCTSQPSQMPHRASKKGGRSGHGLRFRRGAAAPEAVVQPQSGQRHTQLPTCPSEPGFRAHWGLLHMCGPRTAPDARPESDQRSPQTFGRAKLLPTPYNAPEPFASGANPTWWTTRHSHWSNNPSRANFRSRRSCSPSSKGIE